LESIALNINRYGCAANIATASILTEMVIGKTMQDAWKISWRDVSDELGGLPSVKYHCCVLAVGALRRAIRAYYTILMKIASKIYLIEIMSQLKADPILVEKAMASNKVEILTSTRVLEIIGDKTVRGIKVQKGGETFSLPVRGVFVEIGSMPNSEIVDFVEKNQWGEIIVNCACETSFPGLFAAGDVTNVPEKQIIIAAGEGCKATLSAFRYLSRKNLSI
jgi:alkyl hydroperoxide reductase subunit AhpF